MAVNDDGRDVTPDCRVAGAAAPEAGGGPAADDRLHG